MKKIVFTLLVALSLFSCNDDSAIYRVRVLKTKKIILINQDKIKGQVVGDTISLFHANTGWEINTNTVGFQDTSYTIGSSGNSYEIQKVTGVIEKIIY